MGLRDTKTVVTPEQVAVTYRIAGIGTRFAAILVDTCIQVVVGMALLLAAGIGLAATEAALDSASPWLTALLVMLGFLIVWGYFIFWETAWSGRTPGKRLAGIRVLRDGGYPIDFRAAFVRNICRYVDFLPGGYGVGALVMFLSADSKRLGDYVAGTIVVVDSPRPAGPAQADTRRTAEYQVLGDPSTLNLRAIGKDELAVVDQFLARREGLLADARRKLAREIAARVMSALGMDAPLDDYPYERFLEELVAACRERADM